MNDEQQIIEPVPTMAGYKKIPTFKLWIANQFPYIETDFDAITNYELLQAVIKYLNTIIENENNVESNVTALYNSFVNLHDYVETFFENLDVQDEINNKLDKMVEDGTIESILLNYSQVTKVFDTYNDMIFDTSTFVNGMKLKTLGYHYINDGGGADYIVTNVQSQTKYQISIGLNKYIELIEDTQVNVKQFGAYGDNIHDDTDSIQKAIDLLDAGYILLIPKGNYKISKKGSFITTEYGSYTSKYALLIEDKENITVNCQGTLCPDLTTENFNIISLKDCKNILINSINGLYIGENNGDSSVLQNKFLVYCYKSKNIKIYNATGENIGGIACFTISEECSVQNAKGSRTSYEQKSPALFGAYKSSKIIFDKCVGYGSCNDGDISIYGKCDNCNVTNSRLYNYLEGDSAKTIQDPSLQGICVDSGSINCTVENNYVYGYFYGIDVKTACENILVSNNQCVKNKVAIATRLGEGQDKTYNTQIVNNIISVNDGNGSTVELLTGYKNYGIYCQNARGVTISNNLIGNDTNTGGYTIPFIGVCITDPTATQQSVDKLTTILNNTFTLEDRKGPFYAFSQAPAIYLKGTEENPVRNVKISNNTFKDVFLQNMTYWDIQIENGKNIVIDNNMFTEKPNSNGYLKINNVNKLTVSNNTFNHSNKNFDIANSSNVVIDRNFLVGSGNTFNTYIINTCTYVILANNFYSKYGTVESDIGVIQSCTNVVLNNNVARTSRTSFYAVPSDKPNTNLVNNNTTIWE